MAVTADPRSFRVLDGSRRDLAVAIERHEAAVWAACFDAARALPGNPLGVVADRTHAVSLHTLMALDSDQINRVVGLGIDHPATEAAVGEIIDFYRHHGRHHVRVESSPVADLSDLAVRLEAAGLRRDALVTSKMVRSTGDVDTPEPSSVQRLGLEHRDAIGAVNAAAWGDWSPDGVSATWFGATVGAPDFTHYGVFEGDTLVSTGALAVHGTIGWVGFAATHPRYRGHNHRQAINRVRLADARDLGCQWVHVEIDSRYSASSKLPFEHLYDRESWTIEL